jgi:hypothetical protein
MKSLFFSSLATRVSDNGAAEETLQSEKDGSMLGCLYHEQSEYARAKTRGINILGDTLSMSARRTTLLDDSLHKKDFERGQCRISHGTTCHGAPLPRRAS